MRLINVLPALVVICASSCGGDRHSYPSYLRWPRSPQRAEYVLAHRAFAASPLTARALVESTWLGVCPESGDMMDGYSVRFRPYTKAAPDRLTFELFTPNVAMLGETHIHPGRDGRIEGFAQRAVLRDGFTVCFCPAPPCAISGVRCEFHEEMTPHRRVALRMSLAPTTQGPVLSVEVDTFPEDFLGRGLNHTLLFQPERTLSARMKSTEP